MKKDARAFKKHIYHHTGTIQQQQPYQQLSPCHIVLPSYPERGALSPYTWLEHICISLGWFPSYFSDSASLGVRDSDLRLRLLTAAVFGFISSLVGLSDEDLPFPPVLGEVLSGAMGDDIELGVEQVSITPFVSHWMMVSRGIWYTNGYVQLIEAGCMSVALEGQGCVRFFTEQSRGTTVLWRMNSMTIEKDRRLSGSLTLHDEQTDDISTLLFGGKNHRVTCTVSKGDGSDGMCPYDSPPTYTRRAPRSSRARRLLQLVLAQKNGRKDYATTTGCGKGILGEWLEFEGDRYWDSEQSPFAQLRCMWKDVILPFDCRMRPDVACRRADDTQGLQQWGAALEKRQREDELLRENCDV